MILFGLDHTDEPNSPCHKFRKPELQDNDDESNSRISSISKSIANNNNTAGAITIHSNMRNLTKTLSYALGGGGSMPKKGGREVVRATESERE